MRSRICSAVSTKNSATSPPPCSSEKPPSPVTSTRDAQRLHAAFRFRIEEILQQRQTPLRPIPGIVKRVSAHGRLPKAAEVRAVVGAANAFWTVGKGQNGGKAHRAD